MTTFAKESEFEAAVTHALRQSSKTPARWTCWRIANLLQDFIIEGLCPSPRVYLNSSKLALA
jgi:hypothetical protein